MTGEPTTNTIAELAAAGLVDSSTMRGCSEGEISALETRLGVRLPRSYRSFLAAMGREAGTFLVGTDILISVLPSLRTQAERLLTECGGSLALEPADHVFAVHQGYEFLFFSCDGSADPPVFRYEEGDVTFGRVAESFSSWFSSCAHDEIAGAAEIRRSRPL